MNRLARHVMRGLCLGLAGWLLVAAVARLAPAARAQDGDGFIAPIEDPIDGAANTGGSTIQGGASAAVSYYASPRVMYATTSSLVRSGPGTEYPRVGTLPHGGSASVLGDADGGDWLYLEMASGTRGFTASQLLSTTRPPAATSSSGSGSTGGTGSTGSTGITAPSIPVCVAGEVVIHMADGTSICARLE